MVQKYFLIRGNTSLHKDCTALSASFRILTGGLLVNKFESINI